MTYWEKSSLTMNAWAKSVRRFYDAGFKQHYENISQASSQNLELWEFLESQGIDFQGDITVEFFLEGNRLGSMRKPENRTEVPDVVLDTYDFYSERDLPVVVSIVPVQEHNTYAVRTGVLGESGWLEIFDKQGKVLGTATTLCDVIGWDAQSIVRGRFKLRGSSSDSDLSHWFRLKALSIVYPPRQKTAEESEQSEWSILIESCPAESSIEVMKLLRQTAGMGLAQAKRTIGSLPHLVSKPLSQEDAESVAQQFKDVGAQVSIQKRAWSTDS